MSETPAEFKRKVVAMLKSSPMSLSELSRKLKLRRDFVSGYLEAMRSTGEVEVATIGRSKVYKPSK
ncbi:MAG: hypothetical protein NT016_02595 [Candidatus Aenigmarchaeota archaeon]|nr:hypothetical protein [Candidatus Aenigmarchaeota archaeon]